MAVPEVVDRIGEEAIEIIVIDSITETIIDKFAGGEAADDNTIDPSIELAVLEAVDRIDEDADEDIVEKIVINSSIEATIDNTNDPYIELAVLEAAELAVDPSIEAILIAKERVDKFSVDPFIELAVDRVGEEADEDTIDKIARIEAVLDKIAGARRLMIILLIHLSNWLY